MEVTKAQVEEVHTGIVRIANQLQEVMQIIDYSLFNRDGEITEGLVHKLQGLQAFITQTAADVDILLPEGCVQMHH